jgi:hypothetical protein
VTQKLLEDRKRFVKELFSRANGTEAYGKEGVDRLSEYLLDPSSCHSEVRHPLHSVRSLLSLQTEIGRFDSLYERAFSKQVRFD